MTVVSPLRVLISGARAPVALELCRRFGRAGHSVDLMDSVQIPLAAFSRYARHYHRVPPARQQSEEYKASLRALAIHYDLVIPTCEDVLWVSQAVPAFCPDFSVLRTLHNKWLFCQTAEKLGLLTPRSYLLESREQAEGLLREARPMVFKPVYSRFATQTLIRPSQLPERAFPPHRWLAQEYWEGQHLCSFSVAHGGRLKAHVVYRPLVRLGQGAGVVLESVEHPAVTRWVESFLGELKLHGQFAFDFIENSSGEVAALECNPRTTSGVHLFPPNTLVEAYLHSGGGCQFVEPNRRAMLTFPALVNAPLQTWRYRPSPILWDREDPKPFWGQGLSFLEALWRARHGGLLEGTTFDIAWDECES